MYVKPLTIRNLTIKNNIIASPMAGLTDSAFRVLCKTYGSELLISEMISTDSLIHQNPKGYELLKQDIREKPIFVQLMGSTPDKFVKAIELLKPYDFDGIDINCGCPVKKVVKAKCGSYLMTQPKLITEIFTAVRKTTDKPLSAKIRIGIDNDNINIMENAKRLEDAGVDLIALHARTAKQHHSGEPRWELISRVKDAVSVPVIGNGGIKSVSDAKRIFDETGCDGIMIGQAILGKPWFIEDVIKYLNGKEIDNDRSFEFVLSNIKRHLELIVHNKGEVQGIKEFRKHVLAYTKGLPRSKELRNRLIRLNTIDEIDDALQNYKSIINQAV